MNEIRLPLQLTPKYPIGNIKCEAEEAPIPGATWYSAADVGDGLAYCFPEGALAKAKYLTADMLLDGKHVTSFILTLQEGEDGAKFGLNFGLLNQCSARLRMPLEAVSQNRWRYEREGAWLKPRCRYGRVDLNKVDRMTITVHRKSNLPSRWCMTPVIATDEELPMLEELIFPRRPLLDEMGQSTLHEWSTKSCSPEEVTERLHKQLGAAPAHRWPEEFSRWGGWKSKRLEAKGFFYTHYDGQRWWLIDPDGYAFWSSGLDCIRSNIDAGIAGLEAALTWIPDPNGAYKDIYNRAGSINYLGANFIRAFGAEQWHEKWAEIILGELRRLGFNSFGNWSEWEIASKAGMPYVRHMSGNNLPLPTVYRDFPDVFHHDYDDVAAAFAEQLRETVDDPAMIGYFLMNEPNWGFAEETPAAGMLFNTPSCASRAALSDFLRERYGDDDSLSAAWGFKTTFAAVAEGEWDVTLTEAARVDLAKFSAIMVTKYFGGLSDACQAVDPNHLNLGIRYQGVPPQWAVEGMRSFDVFSMNCYRTRLPGDEMGDISAMLNMPILIGEWHFGALDVGLPASGIGHVPDQKSRGKAFRVYLEDAAAKPWCVGVHYFTLYDQSAIGRLDGESYNIGFLDICNRPYEPLANAARISHERLYQVVAGEVEPYDDEPEYLPLLFV